jgi:hypothetical protein
MVIGKYLIDVKGRNTNCYVLRGRRTGTVLLDRHESWSVRQRVFSVTEYLASRTEIQNKWRAA